MRECSDFKRNCCHAVTWEKEGKAAQNLGVFFVYFEQNSLTVKSAFLSHSL